MKETARISKLLKDIYDGSPWIDVSLIPVLRDVTATQAATRISPRWNSIWEIVNHIIYWRMDVLKRVNGEIMRSPADNYFFPVKVKSARA